MVTRRIVLGALAAVLSLTGCSSDDEPPSGSLPDGAALMRESAETTKGIRSAHFTLKVNGTVAAIPVQNAEGDLTREGGPSGGAKGTVKLTLLGQLIEGEFVLVNDSLYLKGPTGDFTKYPAALSASIYDPSAILDPERGIANVLAKIENPKTEGRETIDGKATYKVTGRATKIVVADLVPGVDSDVNVTFWLREDNKQPLKANVALKDGSIDLTLSEVDKPVTVAPPA